MDRKLIKIKTEKQFTSLNSIIEDFLKDKKGNGLINIFVAHTTCAIKVMEGEILLLSDVNEFLDEAFPKDGNYRHDRIEIRDVPVNERVNGCSHMRQLFFSADATIPVQDGKLMLGKWQTVFLIEFDPIRERDIVLTYID